MTNPAGPLRTFSFPPTLKPVTSRHVAVIGAGAAGLVAARELGREGHKVVVFERGDQVGGTWVYTPKLESDPLGLDPFRSLVHSSMYESLRTNLPREVMGFRDFPFVARNDDDDELSDPRRFPGHREVLMYLRDFAKEFGIVEFVRFETEVESVSLVMTERRETQWRVRSKKRGDFIGVDEIFDAVVVCNGHYSVPNIVHIPGIDTWPGKQIHSHNYRIQEPFHGHVVVVIGSSASALDISRDICRVAKEVHITARSITNETTGKLPGYDNIWVHSMIKSVHENRSVIFEDESVVFADTILHCTGYNFDFPFLETNGVVTVDDNCVGPLYKHAFPPALAPWLSFVGLPFKAIPFAVFELQSNWIAGVLSNRIELPSEEEMMDDVTAFYSMLEQCNVPKRYTHDMSRHPFEYDDWLAIQCGHPKYEEWRKQMFLRVFAKIRAKSETFLNDSDDEDLISQATPDFKKYLPYGRTDG